MKSSNQTIDWYISHFEAFERTLNGESASPLHQLRREGLEKLTASGFPTNRHEEWKYTNVGPILKTDFVPVLHYDGAGLSRKEIDRYSFGTPHQLVFVNGHFSPDLSTVKALPQGVVCGSLAGAITMGEPCTRKVPWNAGEGR